MKKTNMLLRILLVLALVVGLCVVAAVADETTKIHCECGKTASGICQICGTEAVEWTPITNPGQMSSGGHYYLTEDVTTSNDTDGANWRLAGQYYLDLNGHTITRGARARLFDTLGGDANTVLVITDSSANPGKVDAGNAAVSDQGTIFWLPAGQLRVYNVTLDARNVATDMGSVLSNAGADAANGATAVFHNVTMYGGVGAANAGTIYTTVTAAGLTLDGCTVYGYEGETSDVLLDCPATIKNTTVYGIVDQWSATTLVGKVDITKVMKHNQLDVSTLSADSEVVVFEDNNEIIVNCICGQDVHIGDCDGTMHLWYPVSEWKDIGNYEYTYLTQDVTLSSQQGVSKNINLSLNGHSIRYNTESTTLHRLVQPNSGAIWTVTNWNKEEGGQLANTLGFAPEKTEIGAVLFLNTATVNLYNIDVVATGAQGIGTGGAIYVNGASTLNMYGCTVAGTSVSSMGGAIYNAGKVKMVDCVITGDGDSNTQEANQGGAICNEGTMELTGCIISGHKSNAHGGNIFNPGTLTMTDCTVSGGHGGAGSNIFSNGKLTSVNCTFQNSVNDRNVDLCVVNSTITGGKITGGSLYLDVASCTVTLTDVICESSIKNQTGNLVIVSGTYTGKVIKGEGDITITGGTFSSDVEAYTADGYAAIPVEGGYTVAQHTHAFEEKVNVETPSFGVNKVKYNICDCGRINGDIELVRVLSRRIRKDYLHAVAEQHEAVCHPREWHRCGPRWLLCQ